MITFSKQKVLISNYKLKTEDKKMKKISLIAVVTMLTLSVFAQVNSSFTKVNAYYKKDGTYVPAHYRTNPNYTAKDNYTTKPNVNPHTGKKGTFDDNTISSEEFINSFYKNENKVKNILDDFYKSTNTSLDNYMNDLKSFDNSSNYSYESTPQINNYNSNLDSYIQSNYSSGSSSYSNSYSNTNSNTNNSNSGGYFNNYFNSIK